MRKVTYKNAYSTWDEALMLGNGRMGAMVYLTHGSLVIDVNHYDVYYRTLPLYRRADEGTRGDSRTSFPYTVEEIRTRARAAHENPAIPAHRNYTYVMKPEIAERYGVTRTGTSHPLTAELEIRFDSSLLPLRDFRQELVIEAGVYRLVSAQLSAEVLVTDDDRLLIELNIAPSPVAGGTTIEIRHPDRRMLNKTTVYDASDGTVSFTSTFPDHDSFAFTWVTTTNAAGARTGRSESFAFMRIPSSGSFNVAGYLDPGNYRGNRSNAVRDYSELRDRHRIQWKEFWSASSVALPDPMLEQLWYINLYSLRCCNGDGAKLYEQACGLNGLWDIRQPTQWGSMWYWDVNIQQAFWPVYVANHAELGRPFYDALESYIPAARERAKSFYGIDAIAGDYPFPFYFCIWPWCAQYFWWHYRYTGDESFLSSRAFPLFEGILDFYVEFLTWDEPTRRFDLFPDISPEQGPVTHNSTISISALKFLLKAGIRTSEILERDPRKRAIWQNLLDHLPEYAEGESDTYGRHIKDSEWAETDIYMAHSSPLMIIYPTGEYSKRSIGKQELLSNTVRWMEHEQALGTHNFAWLAAAYARLGDGDAALRMLHEKGIAYQMRTNGLFAEETERWMQNCLTSCMPVYNPPLIEAGSAVVAAINEMLLQSFEGVIEVFPAVPRGVAETVPSRSDKYSTVEEASTSAWTECSFKNLRAEGGFLISSELSRGRVVHVEVFSERGGELNLKNPFSPDIEPRCSTEDGAATLRMEDGMIRLNTVPGRRYRIVSVQSSEGGSRTEAGNASSPSSVLMTVTRERRRVFLGKESDTDFVRTLDGMTHDYFAGDQRVSPVSVYRFDFTGEGSAFPKEYRRVLEPQRHGCGKMGPDFIRITPNTEYGAARGYGFEAGDRLAYIDRGKPDPLRRDFIAGGAPRSYLVELARGIYRILVVSGDWEEETNTVVAIYSIPTGEESSVPARSAPERTLQAGEYHFDVVPIRHTYDGILRFAIESLSDEPWKINMIIINRVP